MFLIVVLAIVGTVSVVVASAIQQSIGHGQLVENNHGAVSPLKRTVKGALVIASLTVAIFVPLLFVAWVAIGLMRHALGQ